MFSQSGWCRLCHDERQKQKHAKRLGFSVREPERFWLAGTRTCAVLASPKCYKALPEMPLQCSHRI